MSRIQKSLVVQTVGENIYESLSYGDIVYCTEVMEYRTVTKNIFDSPSTFDNMTPNSGSEKLQYVGLSGTTLLRPTVVFTGLQYFDTTIGKPIWYNGTIWVLATGLAA